MVEPRTSARASLPGRAALAAGLAVAALLLVAAPALAGRRVYDSCAQPDHPPFARTYLVSGLSIFNVAVSWDPAYEEGHQLTGVLEHSGQQTVEDAATDALGRIFVSFGINEYGPYDWFIYDGPITGEPVASGSTTVSAEELPCDPEQLSTAPPPASAASSPTAVPTVAPTATPSPTPTATPAPTATPGPSASGEAGGSTGFPWWILIPPGLLAVAFGLYVLTRQGPCEELWNAWLHARDECDEARRRAKAAADEAARAEAERDRIQAELDAIRRAFPSAGKPGGDRSWAESEGRRVTQRDLDLQKAAARQAWNRYRADPNPESAKRLQDEWGDLDTDAAREELRRIDARAAELETELGQARTAAQVARAAADEAQATADRICAEADAARAAWEACVAKATAPKPAPPPPPATPPSTGGTAAGPGTGTTSTGGGPTTTSGGGEPPPTSHHDDHDDEHSCCSSGIWAGYGFTTGGILFLAGYESIVCELFCTSHPDHRVSVKAQFFRVGLGLGGEAYGSAIVLWGQDHGDKAAAALRNTVSGLDGDFSIGIPFAKAAKAGKKGLEVHKLLKNFEKLRKVAGVVTKEAAKDLVEGSLKGVNRSMYGQMGGNAMQGQDLTPGGVVFPIGPGLQAGVWWKPKKFSKLEIISMDCCSCTFP